MRDRERPGPSENQANPDKTLPLFYKLHWKNRQPHNTHDLMDHCSKTQLRHGQKHPLEVSLAGLHYYEPDSIAVRLFAKFIVFS